MSDTSNDTNFSDKTTVIEAGWLNVINTFFHTLFAGAETAAEARTAISSAKSGANSDITSITGLTTDLTVAQGGTGASTLTDGGILLGSGTGAITAMPVLADSEMIVGDGTTDPVAESGATLRTSIGLGTSATQDVGVSSGNVIQADGTGLPVIDGTQLTGVGKLATVGTWTKTQVLPSIELTDQANIDWDMSNGEIAVVTLAGNRTMNDTTNKGSNIYVIAIVQDGTGSRTISWNSAFKWVGGSAPTLTTAASSIDVITFAVIGSFIYEISRSLDVK